MEKITQLDSPDILTPEGDLKDPYRGFIAKSKYNRWLEEEGRRETWVESVNRFVDWMVDYQKKRGVDTPKDLVEDIRHAITYQHVMPSMRALMTAGPALEKNHIAGYNCSFLAVDSIRAFDEALIILMHGTGLGFSVENKYVDKIPEVAESFHKTTTVVRVEDSKEGWAKALKEWLALLWSGQIPAYDVSKVRPKGARLKTFGGRASGPEPLVDLFEFTKKLLMNAAGRRITNLEAHDIMCKVAEIVVVGGVRRCLIATTKVQTPFGWTNISDLQVGDFIVRGGETAEVLAKVNSGVQDTLKVSFGIGNSITMTPNHRVAVFDSADSYVFKEASELEVGDRLVWDLAGYDGEDQNLPKSEYKDHFNAKTVTIPGKMTPDIAWLIGQIHGDGYVGPKTLELSSNDNEFEYMERAQSILKSEFGLDSTVARDSHGGRGIRLRANSRKLALWLSSNVKTSNSPIAIPDFIVKSSREVRAAYLAGLLDSDGRIKNDGVIEQTTTVYPSYAEDLQALLSGLGIFSVAYTGSAQKRRDDGVLAQDYVTVKISNLTSRLEYFRLVGPHSLTLEGEKLLSTKQARDFSYPAEFRLGYHNRATRRDSLILSGDLDPKYHYAPVVITDIEYGGKHEVWDIEISNINEFTANGIVSHNSALISISDLGSRDMSEAKSGAWWVSDPQRALANNSAIYTKKPNMETFFREWKNLYDSKSGERGIFNLDSARKHTAKSGRRDSSLLAGTNPCAEINLRDKEFCNLTEVILAGTDTKNEILEKIRLATILGTWQASLTDFKYLRKKWADNVREEALLGVSMTGIFGNQFMNGREGLESLAQFLDEAREFSVVVNQEEATRIGINPAAAISCVKPSGTVSQLTGTSSGIHPWYAHKYARRVRGNNHDPLVRLMKDAGVPNEPELNKPLDTTVFTFPLQAPKGSVVGDDITAIEHLELWRTYRNHWTEHNPSVTITVREDEWLEVGAYVYKHFDEMSGVSFLPDAGNHTYQQAPFEKLDDEAFQALVDSSVPIPWDKLGIYEMEDATTGSQELACVAGACEVVDLETTDSETVEFTEVPIIDLEEVK